MHTSLRILHEVVSLIIDADPKEALVTKIELKQGEVVVGRVSSNIKKILVARETAVRQHNKAIRYFPDEFLVTDEPNEDSDKLDEYILLKEEIETKMVIFDVLLCKCVKDLVNRHQSVLGIRTNFQIVEMPSIEIIVGITEDISSSHSF